MIAENVTGRAWPGQTLPGLAWPGLARHCLAWLGLVTPCLARPGLARPGLDCPGLAWPGLAAGAFLRTKLGKSIKVFEIHTFDCFIAFHLALVGLPGPFWAGPLWAPWALVARALMGPALVGPLGPCGHRSPGSIPLVSFVKP